MYETISELGWIVGIASMMVFYLVYWYQRPDYFPPGPRGFPFLGYLPMMSKRSHEVAAKLSKKYGPILGVRVGSTDMVFLNDYETIQQAFVKQGSVFSGRMHFPSVKDLKKENGITFLDYGDKWRSQRKFGLMTLRGFGVGRKGMENICLEELHFVNEEIRRQNGKLFDMKDLLHRAVSNNLCNIIFGHRFDYDDKGFNNSLTGIIQAFENPLAGFSTKISSFAPVLVKIPPFSIGAKMFADRIRILFDWMKVIIKEHEESFDENSLRDFVDAFIAEKRKGENSTFSDFQLLIYIQELFAAGSGTAANTILWALLCFLHYPGSQKKIRKEVIDNFGTSGRISWSKKSEMPYTCAFVEELFRFRTIVPLALIHKTDENAQLGEWIIPKGTSVQANIWAVHNDPKVWKNPEKFFPERFLDNQGNFVSSNHVIPFSIGPRHCLGDQLARMEIFIFLVGMVQKFAFLPDTSDLKLPDINKGAPGLVFAPMPFEIVAKQL